MADVSDATGDVVSMTRARASRFAREGLLLLALYVGSWHLAFLPLVVAALRDADGGSADLWHLYRSYLPGIWWVSTGEMVAFVRQMALFVFGIAVIARVAVGWNGRKRREAAPVALRATRLPLLALVLFALVGGLMIWTEMFDRTGQHAMTVTALLLVRVVIARADATLATGRAWLPWRTIAWVGWGLALGLAMAKITDGGKLMMLGPLIMWGCLIGALCFDVLLRGPLFARRSDMVRAPLLGAAAGVLTVLLLGVGALFEPPFSLPEFTGFLVTLAILLVPLCVIFSLFSSVDPDG